VQEAKKEDDQVAKKEVKEDPFAEPSTKKPEAWVLDQDSDPEKEGGTNVNQSLGEKVNMQDQDSEYSMDEEIYDDN
jgi:hypothetical protein